jgi:hypothetical protein
MIRLAIVVIAMGATGCGGGDPQTELEAFVASAEAAAEARDTGFFRRHVSERYRDARGRDRDAVIGAVRAFFLTNARVEVAVRIAHLTLGGEDAAELTLDVGMVSQRGASLSDGIDGELERVELELVREDGEWQVIGSSWEARD